MFEGWPPDLVHYFEERNSEPMPVSWPLISACLPFDPWVYVADEFNKTHKITKREYTYQFLLAEGKVLPPLETKPEPITLSIKELHDDIEFIAGQILKHPESFAPIDFKETK